MRVNDYSTRTIYSVVVLASVLVNLLVVSFYPLQENGLTSMVDEPLEDMSGILSERKNEVLECYDPERECEIISINRTLSNCNKWWGTNPSNSPPLDTLRCGTTKAGVEEVSLITDPANHVRGSVNTVAKSDFLNLGVGQKYHRVQKDFEFLPDGRMLMGNIAGKIFIVGDEGVESSWDMKNFTDDEKVFSDSRIWVKGLAVDPSYERNRYVYIYYFITSAQEEEFGRLNKNVSAWKGRISRFKLQPGSEEALTNEKILAKVRGPYYNSGGGVEIGPEGKLYVSIGDGGESNKKRAQDPESYRGKILRMNLNGSVPSGNPFSGSLVYTLGHREPQGLAWNPVTGTMYSSEKGNFRYDEINRIESGGNYGWPVFKCDDLEESSIVLDQENHSLPVRCFKNWTMEPSRMTFVDDLDHPWYGDMFVAGLRGKHIRRFRMEGDKITGEEVFYYTSGSTPETGLSRQFRDIEYFNGSLYVLGNQHGMVKLSPKQNQERLPFRNSFS